jgi:arylsulfatase A-like enzyme
MRRGLGARLLSCLALAHVPACAPADLGAEIARGTAPPAAPSVLFLIADDLRADAIGAFGNGDVRTPHIDRLVEQGFSFRAAYCMGARSSTVCAPSRGMLLSGKTLFHIPLDAHDAVDADPILPEVLRREGWTTFATGKWNNGREWFHRAFDRGDAIFHGAVGPHRELAVHHFDPSGRYDDGERYTLAGFSSSAFADAALGFFDWLDGQEAERPFFAWVAFTAPHDPRTPPAEYRALYDPDALALPANYAPVHPFDNGDLLARDELLASWPRLPEVVRAELADYYGLVTHMDAQIGRILAGLEERGRSERTLVVFCSDHGLSLGGHGLMGKQNLYEDAMRAPLVFAGPGVPQGSSEALVYLSDVFPTLCELAGVPIPQSVDGRSLVPVLDGRAAGVRDSLFTAYLDAQRAVRDERYKLIVYPEAGEAQLFDLERDPHELVDLAEHADHAERRGALLELLRAAQVEHGDPAPPVGR